MRIKRRGSRKRMRHKLLPKDLRVRVRRYNLVRMVGNWRSRRAQYCSKSAHGDDAMNPDKLLLLAYSFKASVSFLRTALTALADNQCDQH
ncbi:hypothetical protein Tco_1247298 [Tanacetum coccineum]